MSKLSNRIAKSKLNTLLNAECHLFRIPGELRNRIYELVLTDPSPEGIRYVNSPLDQGLNVPNHGKMRPYLEGSMHLGEFNQLKYVCRQLYAETAGLELRLNTVNITRGAWDVPIGLAFEMLLNDMTPSKASLITTVILSTGKIPWNAYHRSPSAEEPINSLLSIARFCKTHPLTTVKYIYQHFDFSGVSKPSIAAFKGFMTTGISLSRAIRGKDLTFLFPTEFPRYWYSIPMISNERMVEEMRTPNLKFWPSNTAINQKIEITARRLRVNRCLNPGWEQLWLEQAKAWVENGI